MNLLIIYTSLALTAGLIAFWRQPALPRAWPLLAVAALPQLLSMLGIRGLALFSITTIALALWCWQNRSLSGVWLVSIGIAMNLLVMGLHGGAMPIHSDSLRGLGYNLAEGTVLLGSKDLVVDAALFGFLGDWIVVDWTPIAFVASPGDVLILLGIIQWLLAQAPQPYQTTQLQQI
jgi:hypothetical protein